MTSTDTDPVPTRAWRLGALARNAIAAVIVAAFLAYLHRHRALLAADLDASWQDVTTVAVGVALGWAVSSGQTWLLYRMEGLRVGLLENLVLTVAGTAMNYLPARVGTLVRFRYLKAVHGLRYTRSMSVASIRLTLLAMVTGVLGLVGVGAIALTRGGFSAGLAACFGATLLLASLPALRRPPRAAGEGRIAGIWNDFADGFARLRDEPATGLGVFLLILVQLLLMALRLHVSLRIVGADPGPAMLLVLAPVATLVSFVSLVPGGLGLREGVMGSITHATGHDFDTGLFAGSVDRAVLLGLLLFAGSASLAVVWLRLRRAEAADPQPPPAP